MLAAAFVDLVPGLSEKNELLHLSGEEFDPVVIFRMLVVSACDQDRRSRHSLQRLDGSIGVGPLRIIIVSDLAAFPDKFDAVLNSLELFQGFPDLIERHIHFQADSHGGHDIFIIMGAEQIELMHVDNDLFRPVFSEENAVVA